MKISDFVPYYDTFKTRIQFLNLKETLWLHGCMSPYYGGHGNDIHVNTGFVNWVIFHVRVSPPYG